MHFFEEHNGPWAVSKAPSHFLFTYSKNYKTSKVEGGTSEWVLCCSHISNTLCGLQPSQRVFSKRLVSTKQMCNSCIICLAPWVFRGITGLLPVRTYCQWQKTYKCHSAVSVLPSLPLILIHNTSAISAWTFPQEANHLSSISVWCLCIRGLIKMILEIKPTQLRKRWLLPVCFVPFCNCSGSFSICQVSAYTASALASYSVGCWSSWKRPTLLDTALSSYLVCLFWEENMFSDNSQDDKNQGFILLPLQGCCVTCSFNLKTLFRIHRLWRRWVNSLRLFSGLMRLLQTRAS